MSSTLHVGDFRLIEPIARFIPPPAKRIVRLLPGRLTRHAEGLSEAIRQRLIRSLRSRTP